MSRPSARPRGQRPNDAPLLTSDKTPPTAGIRLQKILADAGLSSRRAAERLILAGAVSVNGRPVTDLGTRADPTSDEIRVAGRRLAAPAAHVYVALHKPPGYVTTVSDEQGRPTVLDLIDLPQRLFPVGRLDRDSEGLLLLTNDGELTARLTHPRYGVEKEYRALVSPEPSDEALAKLRAGVLIAVGGRTGARTTAPAQLRRLGGKGEGTWIEFTVHEGRKRQIRLMCAAVGLRVHRLVRTRFGPIRLGALLPGRYRLLDPGELKQLARAAGLER